MTLHKGCEHEAGLMSGKQNGGKCLVIECQACYCRLPSVG